METTDKELKETRRMVSHEIEIINKELEIPKKNQIKFWS